MKDNATIVELYRFKYTTFYTVKYDCDEMPLGLQFLKEYSQHKHFKIFKTWIQKIGNERGAVGHFFRQEREAEALPPPKDIINESCDLRWYCLRINPAIVIMFNGGVKTKQKAQHCPNVSKHFDEANKLAEQIWKEIEEAENIRINPDDSLFILDSFKLNP